MYKSTVSFVQKRLATLLGTGIALSLALGMTLTSPWAQGVPTTPPTTPPVTPPTTPTPTPTPTPGDSEITIDTHSLRNGRVGSFYFKRVAARDSMADSGLMLETEGLPAGLDLEYCFSFPSINKTKASCYILGIPSESGEFEVEVTAENSQGASETETYQLKIKEGRRWIWWR